MFIVYQIIKRESWPWTMQCALQRSCAICTVWFLSRKKSAIKESVLLEPEEPYHSNLNRATQRQEPDFTLCIRPIQSQELFFTLCSRPTQNQELDFILCKSPTVIWQEPNIDFLCNKTMMSIIILTFLKWWNFLSINVFSFLVNHYWVLEVFRSICSSFSQLFLMSHEIMKQYFQCPWRY